MTNRDGCQYKCVFHKGPVEWHHPISWKLEVGLYLCQAHHSLLYGRRRRYEEEMAINKTLDEMRVEVIEEMHRHMNLADIELIDKE